MFKNRHYTKELLDNDHIPKEDLYQNLRELDFINTWLGGYAISTRAIKKNIVSKETKVLVDIGSGGGDTIKYIARWSTKQKASLKMYGIDLKQDCTNYANENNPNPALTFITDDYRNVHLHIPKIDILHACLFCHHLKESQIIELIEYAKRNDIILIINDLERNPIAYFAIKILTSLFSKSYLVKNDAPLSVLRGFKKKEWEQIIASAGVSHYSIHWRWAFRHEIIIY